MATNLATKTPGGTDEAFKWLLHSSGVGLSTGYQMGQGDGTDSMLYLDSAGIGVKNPTGAVTKIQSVATAPRTVILPNKDGTVAMVEDINAITATQPQTFFLPLVAVATTNNTTVLTAPGTLLLPADKWWFMEVDLILTKAAGALTPDISLFYDAFIAEISANFISQIQNNASGTVYLTESNPAKTIVKTTALLTTAGSYRIRSSGWAKTAASATPLPLTVRYRRPATGTSVDYSFTGTLRVTVMP